MLQWLIYTLLIHGCGPHGPSPSPRFLKELAHVFYEGLRQNVKPMDGIDHVLFPSNPATADNVVLYIFVVLFALWTACSIICVVMLLFINCCQKSNNIFSVLFILFQLITLLNKPKSDQPNRGISCWQSINVHVSKTITNMSQVNNEGLRERERWFYQ